jgi:hypothetical protein
LPKDGQVKEHRKEGKMRIILTIFCLIMATTCATVDTGSVKFQTKLKTTADQQLAQAVEAMVNAHNNRDIKKHISYYAPDAKIESVRAGGTISRDQYESTLLSNLANLPFIKLDGLKMIELSPTRKRIEGNISTSGPIGTSLGPIIYELVRREGNWLVIEQRYPR